MTVITLQEDGNQYLLMRGVFDGSAAQAMQALAPLLATPGVQFDIPLQQDSYYKINTLLLETAPWEIPFVPPQPPNTTVKEDKQSGYIIDTGSGIAPEHHRAVFEEFRQVGNDLARKAELLPTRQ